jgi:hypothetical protein
MADSVELQVTSNDLSAVLAQKAQQCTALEIQVSTLSRAVQERDLEIADLEKRLNDAEGGKEEVPV